MKKFFGFGSSTPPPPPPPARPPSPPAGKPAQKSPEPATPTIVGCWQESGGGETTEFRADGTVMEKPAHGQSIRGRYSFEGSKLKIKLEVVPEELTFAATLAAETLELKDRDGQVTRYRRQE